MSSWVNGLRQYMTVNKVMHLIHCWMDMILSKISSFSFSFFTTVESLPCLLALCWCSSHYYINWCSFTRCGQHCQITCPITTVHMVWTDGCGQQRHSGLYDAITVFSSEVHFPTWQAIAAWDAFQQPKCSCMTESALQIIYKWAGWLGSAVRDMFWRHNLLYLVQILASCRVLSPKQKRCCNLGWKKLAFVFFP